MDGFLQELGVLASQYMASLIRLVTTRDGLRRLRHAATFKNIFSITVLLFFIHECGSSEDIDPFIDFFSQAYLFSFSDPFKDILTVLGISWLGYYACLIRYPPVAIASRCITEALSVGFYTVHTCIHVFFSLEDGDHVGKKQEKKQKKRHLEIPKALRPPTIEERPQATPQQQTGEESKQRSSSGPSGSGQRQGSGQIQNGSASGSKCGKGKKKKR